jgi:periplasmic protein TonB
VSAKRKKRPYVPILIGAVVIAIFVGGVGFVQSFLGGGPAQKQKLVQEVHLIRPPPPPPPEEKPPPPPPPEEKVVTPEPEQRPDPTPSNEPPPSEHLGLDAEGGAGGDAFGLLGNKGGRELVGSGGNAFAWYSTLVQGEVRDCLADDKSVRGSIRLRMWVREDGSIDHVLITESTGDHGRDKAIETKLQGCRRFSQAPPAGTPQPINLRLVSHG